MVYKYNPVYKTKPGLKKIYKAKPEHIKPKDHHHHHPQRISSSCNHHYRYQPSRQETPSTASDSSTAA